MQPFVQGYLGKGKDREFGPVEVYCAVDGGEDGVGIVVGRVTELL